jgi:hypothetical protein
MRSGKIVAFVLLLFCSTALAESRLPFSTVFKGRERFDQLVAKAKSGGWKSLPIGERTATVGQALLGTRYRHYTLEIDNRVEAPSVNFIGMDCWTFFEIALGFARMLNEPEENWTPDSLLHYIELDRYRGGQCTGEYLSRLHYLEDWLADNNRRGLINDLTPELGGSSVPHSAREMTIGWRHYRYLKSNRSLRRPLAQMEERVSSRPLYSIPKSRVAGIESSLRSGDVIGIVSRDRRGLYSTSHVGLALRTSDGVLHFMHASAPGNYGKVVVDSQLSKYLYKYRTLEFLALAELREQFLQIVQRLVRIDTMCLEPGGRAAIKIRAQNIDQAFGRISLALFHDPDFREGMLRHFDEFGRGACVQTHFIGNANFALRRYRFPLVPKSHA